MKNLKQLSLFLAVLFVFSGIISCDMNSESDINIIGEWDAGYGSTLDISSSKFTNYNADGSQFYSYEIDSFDNNEWNGSESGEGSYGYLVVKCTEPSEWTPEAKDKYMVIRWQNYESDETMEWAEGSDYPENTYFDTPAEAKAGATEAAGFFGYYPSATKL